MEIQSEAESIRQIFDMSTCSSIVRTAVIKSDNWLLSRMECPDMEKIGLHTVEKYDLWCCNSMTRSWHYSAQVVGVGHKRLLRMDENARHALIMNKVLDDIVPFLNKEYRMLQSARRLVDLSSSMFYREYGNMFDFPLEIYMTQSHTPDVGSVYLLWVHCPGFYSELPHAQNERYTLSTEEEIYLENVRHRDMINFYPDSDSCEDD